ncbi:MAG: biotin--[acetyl-CoA-carboxylase] ligase [Spirochaetaceae bacterium]|jgi:BirA family biotin operon repressor/biotin-[acetyl-CoA-carboxylase] ligase|nr:biotin--[acetyl-CoA-carboxylase] ligase [Spirochaetaceae bacterium]
MGEARLWAASGAPHGSVVFTDFQEAGRGRVPGRIWQAEAGKNLLFTLILRYGLLCDIPAAFSLRCALAVLSTLEQLGLWEESELSIKWPNDVMLRGKKVSGILAEGDGKTVLAGIGINILQRNFKVSNGTSIINEAERLPAAEAELRRLVFKNLLHALYAEFEGEKQKTDWEERLNKRLFMKNKYVVFEEGAADSGKLIKGVLLGIDSSGALVIACEGGAARSFASGELKLAVS